MQMTMKEQYLSSDYTTSFYKIIADTHLVSWQLSNILIP